MRLHRFYFQGVIPESGVFDIVSADLVNQVRRVLRLTEGDQLVIFNGTGFDYLCKIDDFVKNTIISSDIAIRLSVVRMERSRFMPPRKIYLCASIVKKDTFEWIAEKATELGVTDIVPVVSERSEKKSLNPDRLQKIVVEASEQSGRGDTPMIHPIMGVEEAASWVRSKESAAQRIAFHTDGDGWKTVSKKIASAHEPIVAFVGPEGGWSEREVDMFHAQNIHVTCLGPAILRAETAVVSALSVIVFG